MPTHRYCPTCEQSYPALLPTCPRCRLAAPKVAPATGRAANFRWWLPFLLASLAIAAVIVFVVILPLLKLSAPGAALLFLGVTAITAPLVWLVTGVPRGYWRQ